MKHETSQQFIQVVIPENITLDDFNAFFSHIMIEFKPDRISQQMYGAIRKEFKQIVAIAFFTALDSKLIAEILNDIRLMYPETEILDSGPTTQSK